MVLVGWQSAEDESGDGSRSAQEAAADEGEDAGDAAYVGEEEHESEGGDEDDEDDKEEEDGGGGGGGGGWLEHGAGEPLEAGGGEVVDEDEVAVDDGAGSAAAGVSTGRQVVLRQLKGTAPNKSNGRPAAAPRGSGAILQPSRDAPGGVLLQRARHSAEELRVHAVAPVHAPVTPPMTRPDTPASDLASSKSGSRPSSRGAFGMFRRDAGAAAVEIVAAAEHVEPPAAAPLAPAGSAESSALTVLTWEEECALVRPPRPRPLDPSVTHPWRLRPLASIPNVLTAVLLSAPRSYRAPPCASLLLAPRTRALGRSRSISRLDLPSPYASPTL